MANAYSFVRTYRKLVAGTTINDITLLSTDYLNHFNEFVMILDMVADMPEMIEELKEWPHKTYQEHFRDSSFTHKDLAISAYEQSPPEYKVPLDMTVEELDRSIDEGLLELDTALASGNDDLLALKVNELSMKLRSLIDRASGIINGAIIDLSSHKEAPAAAVMDQSAIDSLFD